MGSGLDFLYRFIEWWYYFSRGFRGGRGWGFLVFYYTDDWYEKISQIFSSLRQEKLTNGGVLIEVGCI